MKYVCSIAMCLAGAYKDPATLGDMVPCMLLLKGKGPDSLIGKLNGIGGKYDLPETPIGAIKREFHEETGVEIEDKDRFRHFYNHRAISKSYMAGSIYEIHWYAIDLSREEYRACKTQPGEETLFAVEFPAMPGRGLNPFSPFPWPAPLAMDMHFLLPLAYQTLTGFLEQNLN